MLECKICDGVGLVRIQSQSGQWFSRPCECQGKQQEELRMIAAQIPPRFWGMSLEMYDINFPGADISQKNALAMARAFVKAYPFDTGGKGLIFMGSLGVGKTHLAIGVLEGLIRDRGVQGMFCSYGQLVNAIQRTFNSNGSITQADLIEPVLNAEVLVLDELGALRPTDFVLDNVALILGTRYDQRRSTIITTNYADFPAGQGRQTDIERAAKDPTLGDRIGDRMYSRIQEMCIKVEMNGQDARGTFKRARFAGDVRPREVP